MRPGRREFALGALGALAAGCGTGGAPAREQRSDAASAPAPEATSYRLGSGDQLRITVFSEPELSGQFVVGPAGTIAYPLIGDLEVAGLTGPELGERLAERLRAGYVRDPSISVEVMTFRPFYILGEVSEPGTFAYTANLTVMNAVAMANGFTYRADTRRVFIKHDGQSEEQEYPLTSATAVRPGDTVRIPERRF